MPINRWMDKEDVVYIHNGIFLIRKKEWNNAIYSNKDGPRECHSNWSVSSVQFSRPGMSKPHGLQHARPPCPSPTPGVYPNSCPLSRWCHPTISSSVVSFSSCPQPFLTSGSFQMSEVSQRQISYDITYTSYLKKWYKWTYLQNRNRLTERIDLWLSKGKWSRRDNLGILDYQIHTIMYQIQRLTV